MNATELQHCGFYLSGFFNYEPAKISSFSNLPNVELDPYYKNNESYFRQKYYPNWLELLYPGRKRLAELGIADIDTNHLIWQPDPGNEYVVTKAGKQIRFTIGACRIFLLQGRMALFSMHILLHKENFTLAEVSDAALLLRNCSVIPGRPVTNPLLGIIENNITGQLSSDQTTWRRFNPQLKLFLNIDLRGSLPPDQLNELLFELASVVPLGTIREKGLYAPSTEYYEYLLAHNTLNVFHNWKVLNLFDSTVRISFNLQKDDPFNLWETDYFTIYRFALFIRFYLYRTHAQLSEIDVDNKRASRIRDNYLHFQKEFDLSQIAFKFLPDVIYQSFLRSLQVQDEIQRLLHKIDLVNAEITQRQERTTDFLLRLLTLILALGVINDFWDMAIKISAWDSTIPPEYKHIFIRTTLGVLLICVGVGYLLYRKNIRKTSKIQETTLV